MKAIKTTEVQITGDAQADAILLIQTAIELLDPRERVLVLDYCHKRAEKEQYSSYSALGQLAQTQKEVK